VQYRVSGPDIQTVRLLAQKFAEVMGQNRHVSNITYDWNEPEKVLQIKVAQDRARQLGITSQDVAQMLNSVTGGSVITQVRDSIYLIDVIGRAKDVERSSIETFPNLQVPGRNNQTIPLPAFATIGYGLEQPLVWRRSRQATITLKAGLVGDVTPATADCRGRAAYVVSDGDGADAAAAELPEAVPGGQRGTPGIDRGRRRAAADRYAVGIRCASRRARADRDHHSQLCHPRHPDR
jgi:hypothetical protein